MRSIEITSPSARVSVRAAQEAKGDPTVASTGHLELTGTMDEPVRTTREVHIALYAADDATPGPSLCRG